jgi:hypothetical protein
MQRHPTPACKAALQAAHVIIIVVIIVDGVAAMA